MVKFDFSKLSLTFLDYFSKKMSELDISIDFDHEYNAEKDSLIYFCIIDEVDFLELPIPYQRFLKSREIF